jgi:hypothetical protein
VAERRDWGIGRACRCPSHRVALCRRVSLDLQLLFGSFTAEENI